jgi:hypothetical protein
LKHLHIDRFEAGDPGAYESVHEVMRWVDSRGKRP